MLKAIGESLLVIKQEQVKKSASGLILPEEKKGFEIGLVESIGENVFAVQKGYFVYFRPFSGFPFNHNGIDYIQLSLKEVVAVTDGQ